MEQGYPSDMAKVMFGTSSVGPDWAKRTLHADDRAGVRWIYPGGGPSCTYSISPSNATVGASGGSGTVSVTAGSGCTWTASSNAAWVTVTSGASGSGNGSVRYSVAANSGSSRSGTLTIAGKTFTVNQSASGGGGGACSHSYWVPIVARLSGQGGSNWRSDLGLLATGSGSAAIEMRLYTNTGTITRSTTLSGGATTILRDVVDWLRSGFIGAGAVQVCSSKELEVMARIYTREASGKTLGQAFVGVSGNETLSSGQSAVLPMLTQNGNAGAIGTYRTNIGVVNGGTANARVSITLHDNNGNQVGSTLTRTYSSGEVFQYSTPFASAGRNNIDAGYAKVSVASGSGVYVYGSVLDNGSNDPTTIGMR